MGWLKSCRAFYLCEGFSESLRICLQTSYSRLCGGNGQVADLALCNKDNRATPLFNYNHYLRRWELPDPSVIKAFLENTTRRVKIFQKSRLGLDSSLEGCFHIFASKTVRFDRLRDSHLIFLRLIIRIFCG